MTDAKESRHRSNVPCMLHQDRSGATMLEAAVVLLVFLLLLTGMIDLGIGVFRYHQVSEIARQGARLAIVHGELAPAAMKDWYVDRGNGVGGDFIVPATANGVEIIAQLKQGLTLAEYPSPGFFYGLDLDQTRVDVNWLDSGSRIGDRVRVTVTTPFNPIMPFIPASTLSASSTMQIAH